mgnify:FL=1
MSLPKQSTLGRALTADFWAAGFRPFIIGIFVLGPLMLLVTSYTGDSDQLIVGDGREYFEYARVLVIEGHLPYEHLRYPCGVSLIGIIGYAPSVWLARAAGWLERGRAAEGWAIFNQFSFCAPLILLAAAGVWANLRMLARLGFAGPVARFSLMCWLVGTNLPWYLFKEPAMSESATFSTLSIYYYLLIRDGYGNVSARPDPRRWAVIGFFLGLAGAIRQQNILHCAAVPLLVVLQQRGVWREQPRQAVRNVVWCVAPAAAASAVPFVVPWIVWSFAREGARLYAYGSEGFDFLHPRLLEILILPGYHGFFAWTPMFALAALGWIFFFRRHRGLFAPFLVPAFLQYYLIASWWAPSFGASIGHRGFITILPVLLPGLAALLEWSRARGGRVERALAALLLALIAANGVVLLMLATGRLSAN